MLKLLVYAKQDKSFSLCEALFQGMHLYALFSGKYHKIGTEKTVLGTEVYRERFSF